MSTYPARRPLGTGEELERTRRLVPPRQECSQTSVLQRVGSQYCCLTLERSATGRTTSQKYRLEIRSMAGGRTYCEWSCKPPELISGGETVLLTDLGRKIEHEMQGRRRKMSQRSSRPLHSDLSLTAGRILAQERYMRLWSSPDVRLTLHIRAT